MRRPTTTRAVLPALVALWCGRASSVSAAEPTAGRGFAVVVGIDNFSKAEGFDSLPACVADALGVGVTLATQEAYIGPKGQERVHLFLAPSRGDAGFDTAEIVNARVHDGFPKGAGSVLEVLTDVARRATRPDDLVLVFLSTHGKFLTGELGEQLRLILPNYAPGNANTYLTFGQIAEKFRGVPAKVVFILNACHAGGSTGVIGGEYFKRLLYDHERYRCVLPSSKSDELSWIAKGGSMSLFGECLVEALQGAGLAPDETEVTIHDVIEYLVANVSKRAAELGKKQTVAYDSIKEYSAGEYARVVLAQVEPGAREHLARGDTVAAESSPVAAVASGGGADTAEAAAGDNSRGASNTSPVLPIRIHPPDRRPAVALTPADAPLTLHDAEPVLERPSPGQFLTVSFPRGDLTADGQVLLRGRAWSDLPGLRPTVTVELEGQQFPAVVLATDGSAFSWELEIALGHPGESSLLIHGPGGITLTRSVTYTPPPVGLPALPPTGSQALQPGVVPTTTATAVARSDTGLGARPSVTTEGPLPTPPGPVAMAQPQAAHRGPVNLSRVRPASADVTCRPSETPSCRRLAALPATTTAPGAQARNAAPELAPLGEHVVAEDRELTFTARARDADGQSLRYRLEGAPPGARIDPKTGAFRWRPNWRQGGRRYTFDVLVAEVPRIHRVAPGDNLTRIAQELGVSASELARLNGLRDRNTIPVGLELVADEPPFNGPPLTARQTVSVRVEDRPQALTAASSPAQATSAEPPFTMLARLNPSVELDSPAAFGEQAAGRLPAPRPVWKQLPFELPHDAVVEVCASDHRRRLTRAFEGDEIVARLGRADFWRGRVRGSEVLPLEGDGFLHGALSITSVPANAKCSLTPVRGHAPCYDLGVGDETVLEGAIEGASRTWTAVPSGVYDLSVQLPGLRPLATRVTVSAAGKPRLDFASLLSPDVVAESICRADSLTLRVFQRGHHGIKPVAAGTVVELLPRVAPPVCHTLRFLHGAGIGDWDELLARRLSPESGVYRQRTDNAGAVVFRDVWDGRYFARVKSSLSPSAGAALSPVFDVEPGEQRGNAEVTVVIQQPATMPVPVPVVGTTVIASPSPRRQPERPKTPSALTLVVRY